MHPTWLALYVHVSSQGEERATERPSESESDRTREREGERVGGGELEVMLLSRDEILTPPPPLVVLRRGACVCTRGCVRAREVAV
jgi:hypothetical protein